MIRFKVLGNTDQMINWAGPHSVPEILGVRKRRVDNFERFPAAMRQFVELNNVLYRVCTNRGFNGVPKIRRQDLAL